jgi:hypothetical protein
VQLAHGKLFLMLRWGVRSLNETIKDEGEEKVNAGQAATFLVHLKEHGITYAVVLLIAQQLGLLNEVLSVAGSMC